MESTDELTGDQDGEADWYLADLTVCIGLGSWASIFGDYDGLCDVGAPDGELIPLSRVTIFSNSRPGHDEQGVHPGKGV